MCCAALTIWRTHTIQVEGCVQLELGFCGQQVGGGVGVGVGEREGM